MFIVFEGRHLWPKTPSIIRFREPQDHQRRRRPWNRAFNSAALKGYEDIVSKRVVELSDQLALQKSEVDLGKWIGWFSCVQSVYSAQFTRQLMHALKDMTS